ncbi:MAG: ComEA family DNA-binding protein [Pseudomonadota bacterium]|nr:ComEA family DNA-binding protein [Pseudomonadota bacterium]
MLRLRHWLSALLLGLVSMGAYAEPVNINTATAEELMTLPEIGPKKAAAIIEHREQNGPFQQVDDLTKVKGIGPKTVDLNRENLTVGDEAAAAATAEPTAAEPTAAGPAATEPAAAPATEADEAAPGG